MVKSLISYTIFLFLLISTVHLSAQKTDTIYHINGNVLTGEIKKMSDGILIFKMDGMGTIKVQTEKIVTFKSRKLLQVRTRRGELIFGKIDTSLSSGYVNVGYGVNKKQILILDIVEVYPIKTTFWLRLNGKLDVGIDYSKSTNMLRANTSGLLEHRRQKTSTKIVWNTYGSSQLIDTNIVTNKKVDANISHTQLIKGAWLWTGTFGENSNTELGLDLRLYFGGTIQNDIIYTNRHHLYAQLGVSFNREFPAEGEIIDNPEALFSLNYLVYKHTDPEFSLTTHVDAYQNLHFNGRWRLDTNFDVKIEVFNNFFIGFKIYSNFDSKPSSEHAESLDWGSSFTVGYSFN